MFMRMILSAEGYEIAEASNGEEAIDKTNSFEPDVILMDWVMPEMNGLETCRRLKQDPTKKDIPVVMVTSLSGEDKERAALDVGCEDFVTKPVRKMEIVAKMKWWAKRAESSQGSF